MKDIRLIRLEIENFKCFQYLKIDFNGRNVSIYGNNAAGKTSVFDAMMWTLFGKDSQGNGEKNIEVKRLDASGNVVDHDALTAVDVVFQVDGEELTLRRTYREVWSTKRGSSEATFDGHTSEYFINGVPIKKNGFQDKVNELVDEDTFRLLTNTSYFPAQISWQDRRAILFRVAGVMDDAQILATNSQFAPLVESMGRLSIEDYKKKLLSEKKKFVGAKTEIPARISECQKTIEDVQALDFAGAKAEVEALTVRKDALEAQIVAIEHDNAAEQKRLEIREAQLEMTALYNENKAYRASQGSGLLNVRNLKLDLKDLRNWQDRKQHELTNEKAYIAGLEKKIEEARSLWISENSETFSGGICPTCGQNLPSAQQQAARERFEAGKQKRLGDIMQTANSYKELKTQAEDRLTRILDEAAKVDSDIQTKEQEIAAAEGNVVEIRDMEGYAQRSAAINDKIQKLNGELADMVMDSNTAVQKLRSERIQIMGLIDTQQSIISKESLLDYSRQRIESLRDDARSAAECLEAIEKMLYLMEEYSRYKTRFVEDSINGMFRIARFRLFREQANGGIEDRCDVVHEGVPYISVNNGMKINLGIDIINTLSLAYGVRVPLFVDNAESVTKLENCNSQIIRLVVSENDKELRVHYEN